MPRLKKVSFKKNKLEYIFEFKNNTTSFGKIKKKTNVNYIFYKHWIHTPHIDNNALTKCMGCSSSVRNSQNFDNASCIIRTKHSNAWDLGKIKKKSTCENESQTYILTPLPVSQYHRSNSNHTNKSEAQIELITIWNR